MQRDEENVQDYDFNHIIDGIYDLLDDDDECKPLMALNYDFSDLILGLGEDNTESNVVDPELCAYVAAIEEANKKTDPSSSRNGEGETKPKRQLSAKAPPFRPQQRPVANQIANAVPVSSDQQQLSVNAAQQGLQQQPVANQMTLPDLVLVVPAVHQQGHSMRLEADHQNQMGNVVPVIYQQQPHFAIYMISQQDPYQYPMPNQMMPPFVVYQNYINQQHFGMIQQAPPYAPLYELNQQMQNLQLQTQQPAQPRMFNAGPSSHQGQYQKQQEPK